MLRRKIAVGLLLGLVACGSVEETKPDGGRMVGTGGSSAGGGAGAGGRGGAGGSVGGDSGGGAGGMSGTTGAAGSAGTTGAAGAAGTTGVAGAAGTTGSAGAGGRGGTTGTAGAGGTTGAAGTTGVAGAGGRGGTTGTAGAGGTGGGPATYAVSGTVQGAPAGTAVMASSTTTGATCSGNSCQVPMGGSVVLTAPTVPNYYFQGWGGGTSCQSTNASFTVSSVTGNVSCVAIYQVTYLVVVSATGATGTTITPTSPTPGATCAVGSCRVPFGGTIAATAPTVTNWYFNGWSGSVSTTNPQATIPSVMADGTMVANYINSRQEPCRNQPPANGTTTSTPNVTTTYTTAGGWSTPAICPFSCAASFCSTGTACVDAYVDRISWTTGVASKWYGGDDRMTIGPRSVGTGQSVTPATVTTLDRFAFNFQGGFTSSTTGLYGVMPIMLALQVRNAAGTVLQSSTVTLPADFPGGWVYWTIPTTSLTAGTQYIFTSYMLNALTNGVNSGSLGDANAGFSAGEGYNATTTTRDPNVWTDWSTHPWDFQFRLQSRNPSCNSGGSG